MTPEQRSALYTLAAATAPLLVAVGLVTDEQVPLILAAVEATLGVIVAFLHRPTRQA